MPQKNNIKITVKTKYIEQESIPSNSQYVFSYQITIANFGTIAAQLINRYWYITDENNKIEEVTGDGVVGEQPYLRPNEEYTYISGVILTTPTGSMRGFYGMINDDNEQFKAEISEFLLLGARTLH